MTGIDTGCAAGGLSILAKHRALINGVGGGMSEQWS